MGEKAKIHSKWGKRVAVQENAILSVVLSFLISEFFGRGRATLDLDMSVGLPVHWFVGDRSIHPLVSNFFKMWTLICSTAPANPSATGGLYAPCWSGLACIRPCCNRIFRFSLISLSFSFKFHYFFLSCSLRFFGQRPHRGRSPVEHRGTFDCLTWRSGWDAIEGWLRAFKSLNWGLRRLI